ncbi:uncharacterized protein G2W53_010378 [Senna tora]|uniref:Uncharacterized protein n=1 Tax=Senna tora TaxID=362788 RepID=A0A834X050_9FABA|nr:uncharacterized protein G2W53_010378 [Senna tora]
MISSSSIFIFPPNAINIGACCCCCILTRHEEEEESPPTPTPTSLLLFCDSKHCSNCSNSLTNSIAPPIIAAPFSTFLHCERVSAEQEEEEEEETAWSTMFIISIYKNYKITPK